MPWAQRMRQWHNCVRARGLDTSFLCDPPGASLPPLQMEMRKAGLSSQSLHFFLLSLLPSWVPYSLSLSHKPPFLPKGQPAHPPCRTSSLLRQNHYLCSKEKRAGRHFGHLGRKTFDLAPGAIFICSAPSISHHSLPAEESLYLPLDMRDG